MKNEQISKSEEIINFMEVNSNIKLLPYQKLLLYMQHRFNGVFNFYSGRRYSKKFDTYILLLNRALFMEDDEKIAVVSPKEVKEMNREELFSWLQNDYWK